MKTVILLLALATCMAFAGCGYVYGPVKESEAFANDKADVIEQMIKKIQASPTVAGVDEARKIFEAKKAGLIARRDAIKASPRELTTTGI
ncbi:MAG: hypothetical protein WBD16_15610 [Pyrinomonadaceae bacterium]